MSVLNNVWPPVSRLGHNDAESERYTFLAIVDLQGRPCLAGFTPDEIAARPRLESDPSYRQAFMDGVLSERFGSIQ